MIYSVYLTKQEFLQSIIEIVEEEFKISRDLVKEQINQISHTFIEEINCYIEYPYVEKYYRDTYYNFYSKKHKSCKRNSIRISFFSNCITHDALLDSEKNELIEKNFFGFITIRPTSYRILGHSFLSPRILINKEFVCCLCNKTVLISGHKLRVDGFPFCAQDNEAITCSEAAIINMMDYFSNKYSEYSVLLPSQVAKILSKQSYQRQLPSIGLPTENISYVLKKLGFGTVVYSSEKKNKDTYRPEEFKRILFTYIESGIPLIATLSSKKSHHAVIVIGRKDFEELSNHKILDLFNICKKEKYYFADMLEELLIMNDNHSPYEIVNYNKPIQSTIDEDDSNYQIKSFIVPLYPKVHLEAYQFQIFFHTIIENFKKHEVTKHISFLENDNYIIRYFLTSSRSYKNYIAKMPTISKEIKTILLDQSMPRFVWVGEIIKGDIYKKDQVVESIIVVDATESGLNDHLILATNTKYLIFKESIEENHNEDSIYKIIELINEKFITFTNNLKGVHTQWRNL